LTKADREETLLAKVGNAGSKRMHPMGRKGKNPHMLGVEHFGKKAPTNGKKELRRGNGAD